MAGGNNGIQGATSNAGGQAASKQRYGNARKGSQHNGEAIGQHQPQGGHSGQTSNAHSNYVDDNINIQDYSNTNHRKQGSNQASATPGNHRNQSKTSIEQNNYYF